MFMRICLKLYFLYNSSFSNHLGRGDFAKYKKLVVEILEPADEFHGHSAPGKLIERARLYIANEQLDQTFFYLKLMEG